jgi:hypothetical protein
MKIVIRSDKPVTFLPLLRSHKCDFGAEHRSRIIATSAVKGLKSEMYCSPIPEALLVRQVNVCFYSIFLHSFTSPRSIKNDNGNEDGKGYTEKETEKKMVNEICISE